MTVKIIDNMIILSKEKKKYLQEILDMSKKQRKIIDEENIDELARIISSKDKIMNNIDLLDINFLSLYNEIKEKEGLTSINDIDGSKYDNIADLKETISSITDLLEKISIIDKGNTESMKKNLEDVKSELKHVKTAQKAYKGYDHQISDGILIDEKK